MRCRRARESLLNPEPETTNNNTSSHVGQPRIAWNGEVGVTRQKEIKTVSAAAATASQGAGASAAGPPIDVLTTPIDVGVVTTLDDTPAAPVQQAIPAPVHYTHNVSAGPVTAQGGEWHVACHNCRRKKMRCDGGTPCESCRKLMIKDPSVRCVYGPESASGGGGGGGSGGGEGGSQAGRTSTGRHASIDTSKVPVKPVLAQASLAENGDRVNAVALLLDS